jgi:chromosome segregation ATPase
MAQEVPIRTLSERLRELERAPTEAARRLEQANTQIDKATRAIETTVAEEKTAHESTQQVNAELTELRSHINDMLTRNENQSVSAGSLQAPIGTLRLQKKLRRAHENLRDFRTRTQAAMIALDQARTAQTEASEEHVRLSEEVDVLHTHIESLRGI